MSNTLLALDDGRTAPNPRWDLVLAALLAMDGQDRSYTALESAGSMLIVAGGTGGLFITTFIDTSGPDHIPFTLVQGRTGPDVELVIEGVAGIFPAEICVTRAVAIQAAKEYWESRTLPTAFAWRED